MNRPEQQLQRLVVDYIRRAYPEIVFWHCPNGGKRTAVEAMRFQQMGVLAGVPDLHFLMPGGRIAFIELKAGKGKLSASQASFFAQADKWNAPWAVCRTLEEVVTTLIEWYQPWGYNPKVRL